MGKRTVAALAALLLLLQGLEIRLAALCVDPRLTDAAAEQTVTTVTGSLNCYGSIISLTC